MKKVLVVRSGLLLFLLSAFSYGASGQTKLLGISATSQAAGSSDPACLLTESCDGFWSPGMRDHGVDEGIYLQFENPVPLGGIEIVSDSPVTLSINGNRLSTWGTEIGKPPKKGRAWFFTLGSSGSQELKTEVKSLFVKIALADDSQKPLVGAKIYAIHLYAPFGSDAHLPLPKEFRVIPVLPVIVKAQVKASSILDPEPAYQPANLFDSRYDFAWSTNGKKTSGKGEWVDIQFDSPQNITGIIVWNGYQRSETHYLANGRPASLTLTGSGGSSQEIPLKDKMGEQEIELKTPLMNTTSIRLTINQLFPGTKYPDVLLSEIRFLDDKGNIVMPKVPLESPKATDRLAHWLDQSFTSEICPPIEKEEFSYSFKLRSDGSFAVYRETAGGEKTQETVWEGNWEEKNETIRIFGKRYSSRADWQQISYGLPEERSPIEIFQTDIQIREFKSLSSAEQERILALVLKARGRQEGQSIFTRTSNFGAKMGKSNTELLKQLRNAIVVESPLFTDIISPTDSGMCRS